MFNLQIVNELMFCLETGKWLSLEEIVQRCSHPESKLDLILNFLKQNDLVQVYDEKNIFRINPKVKNFSNRLKEIQSQEKANKIKEKNYKDTTGIWDFLGEVQSSGSIVNFIAIPLIIIIGFYLVACTIAPVVDLNTQTFRVIFTLVGGIPSILFYSKSMTNDK